MNPIPYVYVTWDQSSLAPSEFVRYRVYRRRAGVGSFERIQAIGGISIPYAYDYTATAGAWEYYITQVQDIAGFEVESEPSSIVSVELDIHSVFIHDLAAPQYYAELPSQSLRQALEVPARYVQPWSAQAPIAHVGQTLFDTFEVSNLDSWEGGAEAIRALRVLAERQRNGSRLFLRQGRDIGHPVALEGAGLDHGIVTVGANLRLREVHAPLEVA